MAMRYSANRNSSSNNNNNSDHNNRNNNNSNHTNNTSSLYHQSHYMNWTLKCTDLPQYDACQAQAELFQADDKLHLRNLCNDTARCASLIAIHMQSRMSFKDTSSAHIEHKIILDYSRQRVTGETMELLFDLADAVGLAKCRNDMKIGERINATEGKPVLHHVLRMPAYYNIELTRSVPNSKSRTYSFERDLPYNSTASMKQSTSNNTTIEQHQPLDGRSVLREVHTMRKRIQDYAFRVRSGEYVSVTGEHLLKNTVVVATGGGQLGTEFIVEALKSDIDAIEACEKRIIRFISHPDPVDITMQVQDLNPAETLIIVISKTFNDNPVMLNTRALVQWLVQGIQQRFPVKQWKHNDIIAKHVVAITQENSIPKCYEFGILLTNIFIIPWYVNMRFSVCSAVGLLPLSLQYSYPVISDILDGAHDIDEHFFNAPLRDNIPVLMGLLGIWNSTFLNYSCRAILPYSKALHRFPAFVQNIDMESNGKRVGLDGTPLLHRSGEINFGESGGQHSFFQLLHQGRVVPAEFIGFMMNTHNIDLPGEAVSNHDELMSNFFAQPDALAYGKTLVDLVQEGIAEPLREHMVFTGNRPSSSLLFTKLDAFAIGQLMALYEHKTAVQGFIWGINSFDHFGNQLGTVLAKHVRAQLAASRKTGASVQGFNASTSTLLEHYLACGKQQKSDNDNGKKNSGTDSILKGTAGV